LLVRYPDHQPDMTATYETGLMVAQNSGDQHEIAFCLCKLGHWMSHSQLKHEMGIPRLQESLALYRQLGERFYEALVLDDLGWSYNLIDNPSEHLPHVHQSLEIRRQLGDKIGVANALRNLGGATGGFGTTDPQPRQYWQEALQLALEINDRSSIAWNYFLLGIYDQYLGEFEQGQRLRESARQVAQQINEVVILGLCALCDALDLALIHEDYEQAEKLTKAIYPPGSPVDLRLFVSELNLFFFGCAKGDEATIKAAIKSLSAFGTSKDMTANLVFAGLTLCVIQARYEMAAEMLGVILQEPPNAVYLMTRRWGWFQRLQSHLEQELGTPVFHAAVERGKARDLIETARSITSRIL
jgi:tetratricopeptide (TPR) repeat protein